jgi:hypothetical protein
MAKYKTIPVSAAKAIAETYDKQQVIIVTWDAAHGKTHVTTYGDTAEQCRQAALGGDKVKDALGWPPDQRSVPTLARLVAMERRLREAIASDAASFEDDPTDTLRKILGES